MDTLPIFLSAITAFGATLSAGIFVKKYQKHIGVVCAFSAGFFISLSLFDLLPNIMTLALQAQTSIDAIFLAAVAGFVFLFALDRGFFNNIKTNHNKTKKSLRPTIGVLTTLEFSAHGFLEGLAIGISFQFQLGLGVVVAIAVISHDFCDGLSTLTLMLNSGNTLKSSMRMLLVDAITPVLGIATSVFFTIQYLSLVFVFAFLAGSFIYMGAGSLLPEAHRTNRPIVTIGLFLTGFFLIFFLSRLINA
jgi:zinc transporter ZupT